MISSRAQAQVCQDYFAEFFTFNGILVTDEIDNPLQLQRENLRLNDSLMNQWHSKNTRVLLVAEGAGPLLPWFLKRNFETRAIDPAYGAPGFLQPMWLKNYVTKYQSHLSPDNAQNIQAPENSYDVVLAHRLFNNLNFEDSIKVVEEMLRVLKPGGEIRYDGNFTLAMLLQESLQFYSADVEVLFDHHTVVIRKKTYLRITLSRSLHISEARLRQQPFGVARVLQAMAAKLRSGGEPLVVFGLTIAQNREATRLLASMGYSIKILSWGDSPYYQSPQDLDSIGDKPRLVVEIRALAVDRP